MFDLKLTVVTVTYISWSTDVPPISNTITWIYLILRLIVWANTLGNLKLIVGQCDIFYDPVVLSNISITILWICIIF